MPAKRKRAPTLSKDETPAASNTEVEEGTNSSQQEVKEDANGTDPPAKRTRANSAIAAKINDKKGGNKRPSIAHKAQMPVDGSEIGSGEHGEAGAMRMEAPPKAGTVDPVGYRTNPPPQGRPVRVYADGVFDLFHLGHMRQLQQAKMAFPDTYLIVGVAGEAETHRRKGLTVMSGKERAESLRHCRWVDEVIEDCPWVITVDFLWEHEIDYVAHDDIPYGASEGDDIYKSIKERGMFLVTQRTEGVSTTGIISKIVRDYEQYIARQLKRGTSRQELNISWLKKNELDIKRHVAEMRGAIRANWLTTGQELSKELRQFWDKSRPSSPGPSILNGTPGRVRAARSPLLSGSDTPRSNRAGNMDFAAGYAMGLIGGVKSWMEGSKRRNLSDSRGQSPDGSPERSPVEESGQPSLEQSIEDLVGDQHRS